MKQPCLLKFGIEFGDSHMCPDKGAESDLSYHVHKSTDFRTRICDYAR